jgi:hypothetical protein
MLYERTVGVCETSQGLKIEYRPEGEFTHHNAEALFLNLVKAKQPVNMYSLWIDGKTIEPKNKQYSAAQVKSLLENEPTKIELVLVRRPYPQPKLKITFGEGSAKETRSKKKWIL